MTERQRRAFSKLFHREKSDEADLEYHDLVEEMRRFREEQIRGNR